MFLGSVEPNGPVQPRTVSGVSEEEKEKKEHQAWTDLWDLFETLRWLCARSETWSTKFGGRLCDLLAPRERLACPGQWEEAVFVTTDATPQMIGAIDWTHGLATRETTKTLGNWVRMAVEEDEEMQIHIAEFLALIAFACEVAPQWAGKMVLFGGDNQLVRSWVATRRSKVRACRLLIRVLNMVEMRYNCLIVGGWLRTYHNEDADYITRCSDEEFVDYVKERGYQRVQLQGSVEQALKDSEKFGPCFLSWSEDEDRAEILRLREQRLSRQIPAGLGIDWAKVSVREFAEEGRSVLDFEEARKAAAVGPGPGAVEVLAGSLGPDEGQKGFKRMVGQIGAATWVCIVEGPHTSDWGWREEHIRVQRGWRTYLLKFVTTEFGECAARSRCALIAWRHGAEMEDVEKLVVRSATARPLAAVVGKAQEDSTGLIWERPWRMSVEAGIPRQPLLPQVVGHVWRIADGVRENLHGMGGPLRWPLKAASGAREVLWIYDRTGPAGHVRRVTAEEVWRCQGRSRAEWHERMARGAKEEGLLEEGCRGPGVMTATTLVVLGATLANGQLRQQQGEKAGACYDDEGAEAMVKLLLWLRRWRGGDFGGRSYAEGSGVAGGEDRRNVSRLGDTLWWEALKAYEYGESRYAGKRKGRLVKREDVEGKAFLQDEEEQKLPFDGQVGVHLEEWLEHNLTGDLAESTEKMYKGAWYKWQTWARRHGWESDLLSPTRTKLENEDRLLGFLAYVGWVGGSAATVKQNLFAIKAMHKRLGAGDPTEGMHRIWILANAMERKSDKKPRRLGVTPAMMKWLHQQLTQEDAVGEHKVDCVMLKAAVNVAWFFMLRAKEYADSGGVDLSMIVRGCDLKLTYNGTKVGVWEKANELSLQFRKTKADQQSFGESKTVASTGVEGLCPVMAVQDLRQVAPQRFDNEVEAMKPVFRWCKGTTLKRLEIQALLQKAAIAQGLLPARFMSHSLRIGGASALFQATGEIETVKRAGRWTSSAVQRYLWDGGKTKDYSRRMAEASGLLHYT